MSNLTPPRYAVKLELGAPWTGVSPGGGAEPRSSSEAAHGHEGGPGDVAGTWPQSWGTHPLEADPLPWPAPTLAGNGGAAASGQSGPELGSSTAGNDNASSATCAGATSSVHRTGASQHVPATTEEKRLLRYPAAYLTALAWATTEWRRWRARWHFRRAREARQVSTRLYHRRRAAAQLRRWEVVATCGERWTVAARCRGCGSDDALERPLTCGVARACPGCRGRLVEQRRARAAAAMAIVAERYAPLMRRARSPWAWRLVTLTIPHGRGMRDTARAAGRMYARFWRMLDTYVRTDLGEGPTLAAMGWFRTEDGRRVPCPAPVPNLRTIEITAGWDKDGHVHIHALVLSPFLPYPAVRLFWGRVLERSGWTGRVPYRSAEVVIREATHDRETGAYRGQLAESHVRAALVTRRGQHGRPLNAVPWPVCDIGIAHRPVAELVKYVVKDWDKDGLLDPRYGAEAYIAMDGLRAVSASRGILGAVDDLNPYDGPACERCGEVGCLDWRIQRAAPSAGPSPRGPPVVDPLSSIVDRPQPYTRGTRYALPSRWSAGARERHDIGSMAVDLV